ncbi:hypothetical protein BJ508DRAFT_365189 [Ascobolus immersus RN42]|uniref:DUF7918 domain-containing protein n=1 Tax=Ascobolus immersus RN42 TaxID=1160509 RepID=A0A3N4HUL4_ASCIM|nr:hypothetical protein BJ508DRAFT_365189 [Ascobolus immersus RN42]
MVDFENFTVHVLLDDGTQLTEYPFPGDEEPPNTKTVYIQVPASNEPVPFRISVALAKPKKNDLSEYRSSLNVDGIRDAYSTKVSSQKSRHQAFCYKGIRINTPDRTGAALREMSFKLLDTDEGDDNKEIDIKDLGTISVAFRKVLAVEYKYRPSSKILELQKPSHEGKIDEKKMKGSSSSHAVSIGRELKAVVKTKKSGHGYSTKLSKEADTIRFLYRSRAALQSLGIIAYDLPPPRLKRERGYEDVIDLTNETDVDINRKLSVKRVKREKVDEKEVVKKIEKKVEKKAMKKIEKKDEKKVDKTIEKKRFQVVDLT